MKTFSLEVRRQLPRLSPFALSLPRSLYKGQGQRQHSKTWSVCCSRRTSEKKTSELALQCGSRYLHRPATYLGIPHHCSSPLLCATCISHHSRTLCCVQHAFSSTSCGKQVTYHKAPFPHSSQILYSNRCSKIYNGHHIPMHARAPHPDPAGHGTSPPSWWRCHRTGERFTSSQRRRKGKGWCLVRSGERNERVTAPGWSRNYYSVELLFDEWSTVCWVSCARSDR
jgi:hypothetical protein